MGKKRWRAVFAPRCCRKVPGKTTIAQKSKLKQQKRFQMSFARFMLITFKSFVIFFTLRKMSKRSNFFLDKLVLIT